MANKGLMLGIETSCDETAAAVVDHEGNILSNVILSQFDAHADFGGVVPEIAARAHADHLDDVIRAALRDAGVGLQDLDGLAVTSGPGLIGGVLVGTVTAKAISAASGLPLYPINHLEGHALSARLSAEICFPYLLLLVSGGHCQLLMVKAPGDYHRLGTTIDDAAGEAFDKAAKLLGLGVPGGPAVEKMAETGDPNRFALPRPLLDQDNMDFSFSGLKTALMRQAGAFGEAGPAAQDKSDLCAGLQAAIADCLVNRSGKAMDITRTYFVSETIGVESTMDFVVAGGVAANQTIRLRLMTLCADKGFAFHAPPPELCTDNAAMIAWAGQERRAAGIPPDNRFIARPRWPLDNEAAPRVGSGKKGAKA